MGTKNNPGRFDCHAKADPDEPIFTLRANDPLAPHVVRLWAFLRGLVLEYAGRTVSIPPTGSTAEAALAAALSVGIRLPAPDLDKLTEAMRLADAMEAWRTPDPNQGDLALVAGDPAANAVRRCRGCGCTDARACDDGGVACHWVEADLCSACASMGKG